MPIKAENKSRYPSNWKSIREQVLQRAHNKCEFCGVENHTYVERVVSDRHGGTMGKQVRIVLTIAHLDHTPENCELNNLRALCQKCHLTYDAKHHAATAKHTRLQELNKGQLNIFEQ